MQKELKLRAMVWCVLPEGGERLEVDSLQDVLRSIQLQQQHDEDAVVGQLLELRLTDIVILDQHPNDDPQHLEEGWRPELIS